MEKENKMRFLNKLLRNKKYITIIIVSLFVLTVEALAQEKGTPKDKKEKTGYAIGVNIGCRHEEYVHRNRCRYGCPGNKRYLRG